MIELRGLRVTYGRTLALDRIDLDIRPGVTGLFGPNGAGKSTLLRVVAGLLRPSAGTVTIDGSPVDIADETFRRRISYSGHETGLYGHLTVAENLSLFARLYGVGGERVNEVIHEVGLSDRAHDRVASLSAGLKRRAGVARAVLNQPWVLLLDEPYANLDDEAAEQLSDVIKRWNDGSRYALIATHGAKRVKAFAEGGIILQRGNVVSYRARVHEEAAT